MGCDIELERLTRYIHGFISGERMEVDVIDVRELEGLRRQPLSGWLATIERNGCRIRGARGNTVRDVLELLESVRSQVDCSKQELSRRSGLSRGHLSTLLGDPNPNPTLETIVRIALGLDFRLEVIHAEDEAVDDAAADPRSHTQDPPKETKETKETETPLGQGWNDTGLFGATTVGGSPCNEPGRRTRVYLGGGLLGVAGLGVGFALKNQTLREGAFTVGSGILAGTLIAGVIDAVLASRASKKK